MRSLISQGHTVISVLHEISMALAADEMVVMAGGEVRHHGPCDDPQTHQALAQVFGHRIVIHPVQGQWVALPVLSD